jgi:hypothetical protein
MSSRERIFTDSLFGVQIIGALAFCGAYIVQSLSDVTGSSAAQTALVATYLLFHISLGIAAHRAAPDRLSRQAVATYVVWFVLTLAMIGAIVTNPAYAWNEKDSTILALAGLLTVAVLATAAVQQRPLADPMIKAWFAIAYKSVPQVLLAWKFLAEGASGTPGLSVVVGHFTILIRLAQLYFMVRASGLDRNRYWLAISESANEVSWVIATIAWLSV